MNEYEEKVPQSEPAKDHVDAGTSKRHEGPSEDAESSQEQLTEDLVAGAASNLRVRGTLTFHFRDRDVSTITDGYAALRVLTNIREGNSGWEDPLHPCFSDAHSLWITIRTRRLLGASWIPGPIDEAAFSIDPEAA